MKRCCELCGWEIEDIEIFYTTINKEGPLCSACVVVRNEEEEEENGQFGVGA